MENIGTFESGMKKYFFRDVLLNENYLRRIGTFETGILSGRDKVGLVNRPGYLEGVSASCNPTYKDGGNIDDLTWETADIELPFKWCYADIEAEMKRNQALYDLTSNDAFMKIVKTWMTDALLNSSLAIALFGDKTSTEARLSHIDGVIKRAITANHRTTIATADQSRAQMITGMKAVEYLEAMIMDAPQKLKNAPDKEIIMSQAFWDAIHYNLTVSKGIYIETQWDRLFNGFGNETVWHGYKVVVIPTIDDISASITGNVLENTPYFAMMTTESNLRFGSVNTTEAGISSIDIWREKKDKMTYADAVYSIGVMVPQSDMVQTCY